MKKPFIFKSFKYSFLTSAFLLTNVSGALAIGDVVIPWATVGAVGTPDKSALVNYTHSYPEMEMIDNATGAVKLFYQVHDTESLRASDNGGWRMTARYLASEQPGAQVTVRLREVNLETGTFTTVINLDSDEFSASDTYQNQNVEFGVPELGDPDPSCHSHYSFDFSNNAYYVIVKLKKTDPAAQAGILGMKIESVACPPPS